MSAAVVLAIKWVVIFLLTAVAGASLIEAIIGPGSTTTICSFAFGYVLSHACRIGWQWEVKR